MSTPVGCTCRKHWWEQARQSMSRHLLVGEHKSFEREQLHQTKQSHAATLYGFRRKVFVIHIFSSTRPGASRCVPSERYTTEVVPDTRILRLARAGKQVDGAAGRAKCASLRG